MSIHGESRLSLAKAARHERLHPGTLWRWIRDGILDRAGSRIRLEHFRRGGRIYTSHEAIVRFYERLSGDQGLEDVPTSVPRRHRQAEQRAREMGWD